MVVFVPSTLTAAEVDTLLPLGAVFPVNVILGLAPFNSKLAPATKIPPPRLPAELLVKLDVATVVASDSIMKPPPLAVPSAWLFWKVEVPIDALPEPMPPGAANAKTRKSPPPPPIPAAVLRLKVEPVTVKVPVPPVCCGDDGVIRDTAAAARLKVSGICAASICVNDWCDRAAESRIRDDQVTASDLECAAAEVRATLYRYLVVGHDHIGHRQTNCSARRR